ncbi:myocyte-specific enhancer factor 2D homolog [Pristis pectinata]|uniref:myocyte-specific enhancer factor 2D homolog n=1 Tax=Pristis pectinata TaxID=685728 RepID=UPI00223D8513|nr:myocyte-specific enhancer factor 2D homolog [Pristis pectinata]
MKKAYELSVLCDCEIALIIFNHSNKLFQYASTDMDKVLLKYTEYNEPHESRTNADIVETLKKKGFNGCDSPEPDVDDTIEQSPFMEDKFRKVTEDIDVLFKRYGPPNFSVPVTISVGSQNALSYSDPGSSLVSPSLVTTSLTDSNLLSPQQSVMRRNTVSPGIPSRPPSSGNPGALVGTELSTSNGGCPSPVGNGYVNQRSSPGLLTTTSLGKVMPPKSPPPPVTQLPLANSRKPDLRVITSQSKGMMSSLSTHQLTPATQSLSTPVVSVATPSLLPQGLHYSAMHSTYNTDYQLTSADLSALQSFNSPGGVSLGNITTWQQLTPATIGNMLVGPNNQLPQVSTLTIGTSQDVRVKSEPVSPTRDRTTPSSFLQQTPQDTGRSPVDSLSSTNSSFEGSERDEARAGYISPVGHMRVGGEESEDPSTKRMRLDTWVT